MDNSISIKDKEDAFLNNLYEETRYYRGFHHTVVGWISALYLGILAILCSQDLQDLSLYILEFIIVLFAIGSTELILKYHKRYKEMLKVEKEGVRSTVCRESFLVLASGSLAWTKVSRQSNTKSHAQGGNELCEAGRREVAGRKRKLKGLSPVIDVIPGPTLFKEE